MSQDKAQIHGFYEHNPETSNESIGSDEVAAACVAAVAEWSPLFSLPIPAAQAVTKMMGDLQGALRKAVAETVKLHGLNDAQRVGIELAFGHGMMVDAVDELRLDQHPALRSAYLHTVQRILNHNTLFGSLMRFDRAGLLTDAPRTVKDANATFNMLDTDAMPYDLIIKGITASVQDNADEAEIEANEERATELHNAVIRVYESIKDMAAMLPEGSSARAAADAQLADLAEKFDLDNTGPGEEDGPWADGYAERAGLGTMPVVQCIKVPKGVDKLGFVADTILKQLPANAVITRDELIAALGAGQSGMIAIDLK